MKIGSISALKLNTIFKITFAETNALLVVSGIDNEWKFPDCIGCEPDRDMTWPFFFLFLPPDIIVVFTVATSHWHSCIR